VIDRLDALYRRTGANVPTGDPLPSHGAQMEGYFWLVTDVASSRVVVRAVRCEPSPRRRLGEGRDRR